MARQQVYLEDCDGTPPLADNWTQWYPGWGTVSFSGGVLTAGGGEIVGMYYTSWSGGDNQYCELTLGTLSWAGSNNRSLAGCRMQGSDATRDGYFAEIRDHGETAKTFRVTKWLNGTESEIATTTVTAVTGDKISLEAETSGSNVLLRAYHNTTLVHDTSDTASVITGGAPGAALFEVPPRADDISIGTLGDPAGQLIVSTFRIHGRRPRGFAPGHAR